MLRRWVFLVWLAIPAVLPAQVFHAVPIEWESRLRSARPIGYEDGITQRLRLGGRFEWGPLSAVLAPELIRERSGRAFEPDSFPSIAAARQYVLRWANYVDLPAKADGRWRLRGGDTRITLAVGPVGVEASTRSLRWGPGVRYGLILSDPAEGFPHVSGGTVRPIRTPIGFIHGRLVSGLLENSGIAPVVPPGTETAYRPKNTDWRYFTGFDIGYGPRFLPGLTMGMSRSFVGYGSTLDGWSDYFPMFQALTKDNFVTDDNVGGDDAFDQQLSGWFAWDFNRSGFRIWGEYGRNDHAQDARDVITEVEHSRAWVAGARKEWGTGRSLTIELVELQMTSTAANRPSPVWYTHHIVRHGYTHRGRVLGASVGPGSNGRFVEYVQPGWALSLEQVERARDLHTLLVAYGAVSPWSDWTLRGRKDHSMGPVDVTIELSLTKTYNLGFRSDQDPWDGAVGMKIVYSW